MANIDMKLIFLFYMFLASLVTSLRLPKWLFNPAVLTNLPFLPALDLGSLCSVGGEEGVCHSLAKCSGLGGSQAGACTQGRSVCCTEVSSCDSSFSSLVSYFISPQQMYGEKTCQSKVKIQSNVCYLRINLEQFDLLKGRRGKCREDSFSISLDKPGNISSIQNICGDKTGLEVLLPVSRGSVVFLQFLLGSGPASWRMKIKQEKCDKSRRRQADLADNLISCKNTNKGKEKKEVRRMKKQLFGGQRKRRKNKRYKRSLFSWIFGQSQGKTTKKGEETKITSTHQLRANTPLEIASKRVKNVPSDFYKVVTASTMELSYFSGQQTITSVTRSKPVPQQDTKNRDKQNMQRHFKRRKSLFPASPSWSGVLKTSTDLECGPAYLVTPSHALTGGGVGCVLGSMTGTNTLTVIFSGYRVPVKRVTLHSERMALLTLHSPVPSTVPPLCSVGLGNSVRQWVEQAIKEEGRWQ